jgi:hypothetical protein
MSEDNQQLLTEEELDYLYSLYKSSQRGSSARLSKEEISKIVNSDILQNKDKYRKLSSENTKDKNINDEKINQIPSIMVKTLWTQVEISLSVEIGKDTWEKVNPTIKQILIWLRFVEKYNIDPVYMRTFFINIIKKKK